MTRFLNDELDDYSPFSHNTNPSKSLSPHDLGMQPVELDVLYADYTIRNTEKNMTPSTTEMISNRGVVFCGEKPLVIGTLVRIYVKIPDYWSRKSRLVDYRHTDAPHFFQILGRVLGNEELFGGAGFRILSEVLNMDSSDESVLLDYLKSKK